jgi:hypothetical protein
MNKPYHNEGFFKAALLVIFILVPLPYIIGYLAWGDPWVQTYKEMFHPDRCRYEDNKHNVIDNCEKE